MALSTHSCVNPFSPKPPPNPSLVIRANLAGWRRGFISATVACVVIMGSSGIAADAITVDPIFIVVEGSTMARWSDKRRCPPWHANSLENIMPENLPRPSDRRRSDGFVAYRNAPVVIAARGGCYSL